MVFCRFRLLMVSGLVLGVLAGIVPTTPRPLTAVDQVPDCVAGTHYEMTRTAGHTVLRFTTTTPCEWMVPAGVTAVDLLVVGGGGGGGAVAGAGGGGGAVVSQSAVTLAAASYTVTVGAGGAGARVTHGSPVVFVDGADGGQSSLAAGATVLAAAAGGGVGGSWNGTVHLQCPGVGGGGGGWGSVTRTHGADACGTTTNGGTASANTQPHATGGGGGAGMAGLNGDDSFGAGAGGLGLQLAVPGLGTLEYGGGGGGGAHGNWTGTNLDNPIVIAGGGSISSGGAGAHPTQSASGTVSAQSGVDGRGGGGGGAANNLVVTPGGSVGGDGGDGVIIIWWARLAQTLTFPPLGDRALSATPFSLAPTSDSGLGVTVSSSTPGVCSVGGLSVTMIAAGTCTLTAHQAGTSTVAAAPDVTRSFLVTSGAPPDPAGPILPAPGEPSPATTVPNPAGGDSCPCLSDADGTAQPVDTVRTPRGQVPGALTLTAGSSTVVIGPGPADDAPDSPAGTRAPTWVDAEGRLAVHSPGPLPLSGSGGRPGTTVSGGVADGVAVSTTVGADGTWDFTVEIPGLPSAHRTLTVEWTDTANRLRRLEVPLSVIATGNSPTGPRPVAGGGLLRLGPTEARALGPEGATIAHRRSADVPRQTLRIATLRSGTAEDITVDIRPLAAGQVTPEGRLRLTPPSQVAVTGTGLLPRTSADVWIMSTATHLGTAQIRADGTFDITLAIPPTLGTGDHTVQIDAVDAEGRGISVAVGVTLTAPALPATGTSPSIWALLLLAVGAVLALGARRPGARGLRGDTGGTPI